MANERLTGTRSGASVADPIVIDASTASPPPKMQDREFLQGSSTGAGLGPVFLGRIDLCTPSASP
jgi:hypothetical protein